MVSLGVGQVELVVEEKSKSSNGLWSDKTSNINVNQLEWFYRICRNISRNNLMGLGHSTPVTVGVIGKIDIFPWTSSAYNGLL